jgi:hypothetical protein
MRIWPAGYEEREALCRNTYCLPKKVKRLAFAEGYNIGIATGTPFPQRAKPH